MSALCEDRLLDEFRAGAVEWEPLPATSPKKANKIFDRLHKIQKELRKSPHGREGLERLVEHENIGVRLLAAGACLAWNPAVAIPALEKLRDESDSLHAVTAKYTLKTFEEGTLDLDW